MIRVIVLCLKAAVKWPCDISCRFYSQWYFPVKLRRCRQTVCMFWRGSELYLYNCGYFWQPSLGFLIFTILLFGPIYILPQTHKLPTQNLTFPLTKNLPLLVSVSVLLWVSPSPSSWCPSLLEPCWLHSSSSAAVWVGEERTVGSHKSLPQKTPTLPHCMMRWELASWSWKRMLRMVQWKHWRWSRIPHMIL